MKGLQPSQLEEIRAFVQEHHQFGYVPKAKLVTKYSFGIKYIDACYDSRDQTYWCVSLRGMGNNVTFRTNQWALLGPPKQWKYDNLYDLIMAYLKDEFIVREDFYNAGKNSIDERIPTNSEIAAASLEAPLSLRVGFVVGVKWLIKYLNQPSEPSK